MNKTLAIIAYVLEKQGIDLPSLLFAIDSQFMHQSYSRLTDLEYEKGENGISIRGLESLSEEEKKLVDESSFDDSILEFFESGEFIPTEIVFTKDIV